VQVTRTMTSATVARDNIQRHTMFAIHCSSNILQFKISSKCLGSTVFALISVYGVHSG